MGASAVSPRVIARLTVERFSASIALISFFLILISLLTVSYTHLIGGSSYVPPLPNESDVKDKILEIIEEEDDAVNIAIRLCLYCMKTQIFLDGNKRASVIFANHYLIAHGGGFLVIPESEVPEFKKLLRCV